LFYFAESKMVLGFEALHDLRQVLIDFGLQFLRERLVAPGGLRVQKTTLLQQPAVRHNIRKRQVETIDWVWASPQKQGRQPLWLATVMRYYIQPAARRAGINKKIGWHTFRHTFSTLIKSLGVDAKVVQELLRHASFKTTMDGYTQALEAPKRQAQAALADLIMRTGKVGHA
jgi:site-specific recombinase XerD